MQKPEAITQKNMLQQEVFNMIRQRIAPNLSMPDEIAELLQISNDSAYRRIRGEKLLTFEELIVLCKKYRLSLDRIVSLQSDNVLFNTTQVAPGHFDLGTYLDTLVTYMQPIAQAGEKLISYEAKDIPLFYYFYFPKLAAFKYFFWMKTVLCLESHSTLLFEDNDLEPVIRKPGSEIVQLYNRIPSAEIWSTASIHATLKQIAYYQASGLFRHKDTATTLLHDLSQLVAHVKTQAEAGSKSAPGKTTGAADYRLFINDIVLGQNSVVIEADGQLRVFINHNTLNYMSTADPGFCAYTQSNIRNSMKKSELISGVGEKARHIFFNTLQDHIDAAAEKITHPR